MARGTNRSMERREQLRVIADENTEARASRTDKQQLATLDERLGEGVGAKKERARLAEKDANA